MPSAVVESDAWHAGEAELLVAAGVTAARDRVAKESAA
jgi:hypothetical protein